jgi:serine/threonine-protein kinase
MADVRVPKQIGKYGVRSVIVSTAYSTVYQGVDPDLKVGVALKVFDLKGKSAGPDSTHGPDYWRERFFREARLLARIDHPHIISVRDMGTAEDGRPYFVMPLIDANLVFEIGRDAMDEKSIARLPEELRPRAIPLARVQVILRQLLSALALLHQRGLVHRDIKPANLLLTRRKGGTVKLCDFGMVKFPDWSQSKAGTWLGTPDYIAPEQRENAPGVDARADVYSVGALAYRMLSGRLPVGRFPSLAELREDVPPALDGLVHACLSSGRKSRPSDASAMRAILDRSFGPSPLPRRAAQVVSITRERTARE